ncbi:MAG: hypothetical protein MK085_08100 [Phycisphaerales bacterium]|nr:hypothetical protein [Phycisphaerales bacterium]
MSTIGQSFVIGRSTGRCAASDRVLEPGETCVAVLARPLPGEATERKGKRGGPLLERLDFAAEVWDSGPREPELVSRMLCWWRTTVPEPDEPRRAFVDESVLLDLFERLDDDEDERRQAFRFVLGLILLRRRKLRMIDREQVDDGTAWVFKRVGGGDDAPHYRVLDPQLDESDAEEIAEQLSEILADEA